MKSKSPHATHTHAWLITIAFTIIALLAYLFTLAHTQLDPQNRVSLTAFWITYTSLWTMLSIMVWQLFLKKHHDHPIPKRISITIIFAVAIIARGTVVFTTTPTLSDDIYRYIHDGAVLANGENPYLIAPAHHPDPPTPYTDRINNHELTTIYLPVSQYAFAALWKLSPPGHETTTFRLGFALFDLIIIALLILALHQRGHTPWFAALYAWHPLPLIEIAGSGHQDTLGIACLIAALLCWDRGHAPSNLKRLMVLGMFVALAALVKPIVIPILIPTFWTLRKKTLPRLPILAGMTFPATFIVLSLLASPNAYLQLFDTLRTFARIWAFNGPIHEITRQFVPHTIATGLLAGIVLFTLTAWLLLKFRKQSDTDRTEPYLAAWLVGALLVSSTVHPWYLLWSLALIPLLFSAPPSHRYPRVIPLTIWLFSLTIAIAIAPWHNPDYWTMPPALLALEFLPVLILPPILAHLLKRPT